MRASPRLDEGPHAGALQLVGRSDGVPRSVERGLDGSEDLRSESRTHDARHT
jgi:hypothetical protein